MLKKIYSKRKPLLSILAILFLIISCTKPPDIPDPSVPVPPTGLTAYGVSITKVKLSWSDNSTSEVGYKIERKTATTSFTIVGSVAMNVTHYIDSNLTQNITYTYRIFPFYSSGGSPNYSNEVTINTGSSNPPSLNDTALNCSQVWMSKNLDIAYYSNGDPIPQVTDSIQWANLTTGAWCYYHNDPANGVIYGKLYNWYAVTDPRGLAPAGWHIPSFPEYQTLRDCLAGKSVAGGKMKEVGTVHWTSPNAGATNSSGFTALPGGYRSFDGGTQSEVFKSLGHTGIWYCSTYNTSGSTLFVNYVALYNDRSDISEVSIGSNVSAFYNNGYSIRCIKGPEIKISVTTDDVSGISTNTAISGGYVTNDGGYPVFARGVVWSTSPEPTSILNTRTADGTGLGAFTSNITGLSPNTVYYVRAYASNYTGTAYGNQDTITTVNYTLPTISTSPVTLTTQTTSVSGGNITNDGANPISARGVVWSTIPNPTITLLTRTYNGTGSAPFTSNITGLNANTTYYIKAYATNSAGTAYGNQVTFTTLNVPSVAICNQVWMSKNLDVTTYRNGDPIPQVTDSAQWMNLTTGAWCYLNNDPAMGPIYGKLYNWYAVNDSRGLAPSGWHIPNNDEWGSLISCLNSNGNSCISSGSSSFYTTIAKLQSIGTIETGTGLWHSNPWYTATNSSGFSALPGSYRDNYNAGPSGFPQNIGYLAAFWTSSVDPQFPNFGTSGYFIASSSELCFHGELKESGRSMRCVKD